MLLLPIQLSILHVPSPAVTPTNLLFNVGAGLGNLMMVAETGARMDVIIVCVAGITVMGVAMSQMVSLLSAHALRWRR